jgi:FKBP-type peptidyl-prolyl cis-trans isomerase
MRACAPLLVLAALTACSSRRAAPLIGEAAALAEAAHLAANARRPGVVVLPGLQYQVLRSGPPEGRSPARYDDITVRYTGRFVDGRVFSSSPDAGAGTINFTLQKLIPGWLAVLQRMRPGDLWRVTVPANLGYAAVGKSYIPPDSTLVFDIELVSVTPGVAP